MGRITEINVVFYNFLLFFSLTFFNNVYCKFLRMRLYFIVSFFNVSHLNLQHYVSAFCNKKKSEKNFNVYIVKMLFFFIFLKVYWTCAYFCCAGAVFPGIVYILCYFSIVVFLAFNTLLIFFSAKICIFFV